MKIAGISCCNMDILKNRMVVHSAIRCSIPGLIPGRGARHGAYHGGVMVPPCRSYGRTRIPKLGSAGFVRDTQ